MRPLLSRDEIQDRLGRVFPRDAFDSVNSNPLSAAALAAMLFVDAVVPDRGEVNNDATWARPSMCLWLNDEVYAQGGEDRRAAWLRACLTGRKAARELEVSWGVATDAWYADNSRETLRDETFPAWLDHGAIRVRPNVATTSSAPRWALATSFADLFDPALEGEALDQAIETWRGSHMSPGDRFRISTYRDRERSGHAVEVRLPGGGTRLLEPGVASQILRGVVESWAPARLTDPVVLSISEPGDKVYLADASRLRSLGITLDSNSLLPDALIVDIGEEPPLFWIVEAVATDGPVTEDRRRQLLRWASEQRIPPSDCRFLTAFVGRNDGPARKRLKDLAVDTFAWFLSEPTRELAWYEMGDPEGEGPPDLTG